MAMSGLPTTAMNYAWTTLEVFTGIDGPASGSRSYNIQPYASANTQIRFRVIDFDGVTSGPVQFVDGTPASGFTYTIVALGDAGDDVSFSNDGGTTFTYTPTADANGVDTTVTHIRINPKGDLLCNNGGGDP